MRLQELFLTFFGAGRSPIAPGTVGTLAALPVGIAVLYALGPQSLTLLTLAVTVVGIFEVTKYENRTGRHDDSAIVIDEAAGVWLALLITWAGSMGQLPESWLRHPQLVWSGVALSSFFSFRLFDIWKPSTIGWIDRNLSGGLGVMLDDTLAGIAAGFLNLLLLWAIVHLG